MRNILQANWLSELRADPRMKGLRWLESDGMRFFPGPEGMISSTIRAVLIKRLVEDFNGNFGDPGLHVGPDGVWFTIVFDATTSDQYDVAAEASIKINEALDALAGVE